MIVGLNNKNERIFAFNAEKSEKYICCNPECKHGELILCKGKIVAAYFRHKQIDFECNHKNESVEHEIAKLSMVNALQLNSNQIEYIGIKGIRPDVLVNKYGFEFQKSAITFESFEQRNKLYLLNNLIPMWFFYIPFKKMYKIGNEYRFKEVQLFYEKDYIPIYTIDENNDLILIYLKICNVSRYYENPYGNNYHKTLLKTKEVSEIKQFKLANINDFKEIVEFPKYKLNICFNCKRIIYKDKFIASYNLCSGCYYAKKHKR